LKNPKTKRGEAERAGEWFLHEIEGCVETVRAIRTKWQRQDLFASDVVGKKKNGAHVYAQVTAGQDGAVRVRRRKLDKIPWHPSDKVFLLQLVHTANPANARSKLWFFRVHRMNTAMLTWKVDDVAQDVPKLWFKAWKNEEKKRMDAACDIADKCF